MTPRQLRGLAELHHEAGGDGSTPTPPRQAASTQGGAGWLMAVSQSLERNRPNRRVNAPTG
jgi:hypothetical protein